MNTKVKKKRSVADVPIFLDDRLFRQLRTLVEMRGWTYKTNRELYEMRDSALICLLILTGVRISEALVLRKFQFRSYRGKIELANVKTNKKGLMRKRIILPKRGSLAYFTRVFEEWLQHVPDDKDYVFPSGTWAGLRWSQNLSRYRAHRIVKVKTGLFNHWFRGVCETIYGKKVFKSDAWKLKQFMGLKRLDSTVPYVGGTWEEDEEEIYKL